MLDTEILPEGAAASDLDPFTHENIRDPYGWHAAVREPAPLVWLSRYQVWGAARYDEVFGILKDWETYNSSAGVGLANFNKEKPWRPPSKLLEADPPDHTPRREVAGRVMSQANLRKLRPAFAAEAASLVDRLLEKGGVNGVTDIARPFILKVFPDSIGLSPDNRDDLLVYGDMVFNGFGPHNDIFDHSMREAERVVDYIMGCCTRPQLTQDGLGAQVYEAADAGEITEEEALFIVRSFLSAGLDTTVDVIGNALNCFAQNPSQWEKLRKDPSHMRAAIEEVVRFDSPLQVLFRTTNCEVEIGGITVAEDEKIMISPGSANRDPRKWDRPDVFDIDRDIGGHVGFGFGIHECVGQVIARMELDALFTEMANRVASFELQGTGERRLNNTLHGFESLPLALRGA